jgi:hypothetical protein
MTSSSLPILEFEALDAAEAATAKARIAASACAAATKTAATASEELAAWAWASHEACETAVAAAKKRRLPSPAPHTYASGGSRGAVAMKSVPTWWHTVADPAGQTAAVAVGGAHDTLGGARTMVLALRAALAVAEAAEKAATEAADAVHLALAP